MSIKPVMLKCVLVQYSRDADLKQVVLDELFSQHCDAELDAELHETAAVSALIKHIKAAVIHPLQSICSLQNSHVSDLYLLHAIGLKHVEITAWTPTESVRKHSMNTFIFSMDSTIPFIIKSLINSPHNFKKTV